MADQAHGALALGAFERIDFVDVVNQTRPGGAHARGFANIDLADGDPSGLVLHAAALSPAAIRVPVVVAHQMLQAIGDVTAEYRGRKAYVSRNA